MLTGVDRELLEFCTPWLAREPRLLLACQFAAPGRPRERFAASAVIIRELAQASIGVSDRRIAEAKLAWWVDEAAAWALGMPRHPLARGLDVTADAQALASLSMACAGWLDAPTPPSFAASWAGMLRFGQLTAALAGFGTDAAWALAWLCLSLRQSLQVNAPLINVLPMDWWARHGLKRAEWAHLDGARRQQLLADVVALVPADRFHGRDPAIAVLATLERRWLQQLPGATPGAGDRLGVRDAFAAWRAGRSALRQG